MLQQIALADNWRLKQRDPAASLFDDFSSPHGWIEARVPGTVHQDLLAVGRIADPFIGLNEREAQWVGEADWLYRCQFDLTPDVANAENVDLCFDGLDTCATVWLNGEQILTSDNMFIPQRVSVQSLLRPEQNDLWLLFESALRRGHMRQSEYGALPAWNGDPCRLYVRKAQYHFGWDWGPVLITAGPWRPIRLEAYAHRIADVHCPSEVAADLHSAVLPVRVTVEVRKLTSMASDLMVRLSLHGPTNELLAEANRPVQDGQASSRFEMTAPHLWWPRGYGQQPLYRLVATLESGGETLDRRELRLGLRRLSLLQEPLTDQPGKTFLFEVNNMPIFCGGANWIPADSFLPRIPPGRRSALVHAAADANMTMLRVWGGGIYEEDAFYDLCDELGLLVWQDFMFACGIYPAFDWFQASVKAEAEATIRRLRHHPSLALWCGNNEDYQIAQSIGAYDATFEGDFTTTSFPAREIYERLLSSVCAALDPTRRYWPGSPYGGADVIHDLTSGDRHIWEVWHGRMADYHEYPRFAARFVSEFGMQAMPDFETITTYTPPEERYPQSWTMEYHNKATDGPRRLAAYLSDTVRVPADLEGYISATQLLQADALAAAYRGWRRRWGGPGRYATAGALVWQLDDCWPGTSWSLIDYFMRPKPAYYVVRRALAPLVVGLARATDGAEVWAVNGTEASLEAELALSLWELDGRKADAEQRTVVLQSNQATDLGTITFDVQRPLILSALLLMQGTVVAREVLWPEPFKYLRLPAPEIEMTRLGERRLRLRATRPAKGVWLRAGSDVQWSDNMLDLLPGEEQIIVAQGLTERTVQVRWLR